MKLSTTITALLLAASSQAQICNGCGYQKAKVKDTTNCDSTSIIVYSRRGSVKILETTIYGPAGEKIEPKTVQTKDPCLKCGQG